MVYLLTCSLTKACPCHPEDHHAPCICHHVEEKVSCPCHEPPCVCHHEEEKKDDDDEEHRIGSEKHPHCEYHGDRPAEGKLVAYCGPNADPQDITVLGKTS